jgi:hypothetical protein
MIPQRPGRSFLTGFTALFLLWGILSFWISTKNDHILAHKVSMLMLKMDSPFLLIFATALIAALVGGLAALSGSYLRSSKK